MIPTRLHVRFLLRLLLILGVTGGTLLLLLMVYIALKFDGSAVLPVDCAMVFGAAVHSKDDPGPGITRRVETAANLYHQGLIKRVFLSGGKGDATKESEAQVMRKVALLLGIAPESLKLEEFSTSTWENLEKTRPLMQGCESVVGISDRYHLARIGYLAYLQGWGELQTYPADRRAPWYFEVRSVLREMAGLLYYFFAIHERFG